MTDFAPHSDPDRLTARQREVLKLVAAGRTNAEIGEALGISFETAKMHVGDILDRLGVDSREEAAQIWRQHRRPAARLGRALSGLALTPLQRIGGMIAGVATVAAVGLVFVALAREDREPGAPPAQAATTATPAPTVELIGTRWDLVTIDGQPVVNFESAAYLRLTDQPWGSGRWAAGYSGCNGFGGEYVIQGTQVSFDDLFSTAQGCFADPDNPESRFYGALSPGPVEVKQSGVQLVLTAPNATRLEFVARTEGDPDGVLTMHRWQLTNIDGRGEAAFASNIFDFTGNGTFSTTTACGLLQGTYERRGFEMTMAVNGDTPAGCPEPDRTFDAKLRASLMKTTTYVVDLTVLTLSQGDTGAIGLSKVEP